MVKISKKEIVRINKKHGGVLVNPSNLDFAIDAANMEKDIFKSNAYLIRGIISGHPFLDGNKRTALEISSRRFKKHKIKCDTKQFLKGLVNIAKRNETNINRITRRLKRWCKKQ